MNSLKYYKIHQFLLSLYILYNQSHFSSKNAIPWEEIQAILPPVSQIYAYVTLPKLDVTGGVFGLIIASQRDALLKYHLKVQE